MERLCGLIRESMGGWFLCFFLLATASAVRGQAQFALDNEALEKGAGIWARNITQGDFDNDGRVDLFLASKWAPPFALYRNDGGRFVDVSMSIHSDGAATEAKGAGAVFGDFDNDGDQDLFIPTLPFKNILLRNDRGSFVDVTTESGLLDERVSDNAMWLDFDRDGFLDLYVGNLGDGGAVPNQLFRNLGDGRFEDVSEAVGLPTVGGGSNGGMSAADLNGDGWPDIYTGRYGRTNRLYLSDGMGGFALSEELAVSDEGEAYEVVVGDIDGDGDMDLFQAAGGAALEDRDYRSLLLLNTGRGSFLDITVSAGLAQVSATNTEGAGIADFDNDGDLDLITGTPHFLFMNQGDGRFLDATALSGIDDVNGNVATGDYDGDGRTDVIFATVGHYGDGFGGIYRNLDTQNHWLSVDLVGTRSNRDGVGARVVAWSGSLTQKREQLAGGGYTQDDRAIHFGLGQHSKIDSLAVEWPSGGRDLITGIAADQKIRVIEGSGVGFAIRPSIWVSEPPRTAMRGALLNLHLIVQPALFEPVAQITSVTGNLSAIGGGESVPFVSLGDGTYELDTSLEVASVSGVSNIDVFIDQETSLGPYWIRLQRQVEVIDIPTAVVESLGSTIPASFDLAQNHPNPFNPETTIHFDLPTQTSINLALYNSQGQRVTTLASGQHAAGSYRLQWDGRNSAGQEMASGVYFYRLAGGSYLQTRKLVLVR